MSLDSDDEVDLLENINDVMEKISEELTELYAFRDLFFETHSIELASKKNRLVDNKKLQLLEKLDAIDVDTQIPFDLRPKFLYMKGRCYNIGMTYDARASQCLSRAVRLNPRMVEAWNDLGECYWKNMNIKEAKASFEGAIKHEPHNRTALRCLSIILRQEKGNKKTSEAAQAILKSVEMAKEAVGQDLKDGASWVILGNAYLCQFFTVAQDPATLKLCLSAYKQAWTDPITKGQPDLYYNKGIALKYEESYLEALQSFDYACRLHPPWEPPRLELSKLLQYLASTDEMVRSCGKIKSKRLTQLMQSIDQKMLGGYGPGLFQKFGDRRHVLLEYVTFDQLQDGKNEGKVILGRVVGSIHNENSVPFTFTLVDTRRQCVCVTVYNWADGRGAIIGDTVALPEPVQVTHAYSGGDFPKYNFKSIRLNNPMLLLVNGKRVGHNQFASTRVTSTYEIH